MSKNILNLTGHKYGKLSFISREGVSKYGQFKCDCGNLCIKDISKVRNGSTSSCGCLQSQSVRERETTHGCSHTPEFVSWQAMLGRCYNPNNASYKRYGGRGIKVCDKWKHSFVEFFKDMGYKPSKIHSVERIENDGNYEPNNCRWATPKEQQRNKSNTLFIEYNGEKFTRQEWADKLGWAKHKLLRELNKKEFGIILSENNYNKIK